jgi:hypothetical protein
MKFMHFRYHWDKELEAKGGVTVAYEVKDNVISMSMAKCHERDNFCRKIGRDIAMGRYMNKDQIVFTAQGEHIRKNVAEYVYKHYLDLGYENMAAILY